MKYDKSTGLHFDMNLKFLNNNFEQVMDWDSSYGLFPGKSCFIFPEHSNRVFLGTNTIPMHNICPKLRGFN